MRYPIVVLVLCCFSFHIHTLIIKYDKINKKEVSRGEQSITVLSNKKKLKYGRENKRTMEICVDYCCLVSYLNRMYISYIKPEGHLILTIIMIVVVSS